MNTLFDQLFTRHPASVGETYAEHLAFASRTAGALALAACAALVHGLVPCLFERTASRTVLGLADGMRGRVPPGELPTASAEGVRAAAS